MYKYVCERMKKCVHAYINACMSVLIIIVIIKELCNFLFVFFSVSARIGQVAMKHAALQYNMDPTLAISRNKSYAPSNPFTG